MLDVLKTRRSIRKYTDEMPRDEDLERIVEAGLYAPTGMGRQGVKFVVVKNKEMRDHLSKLNAGVMGRIKILSMVHLLLLLFYQRKNILHISMMDHLRLVICSMKRMA